MSHTHQQNIAPGQAPFYPCRIVFKACRNSQKIKYKWVCVTWASIKCPSWPGRAPQRLYLLESVWNLILDQRNLVSTLEFRAQGTKVRVADTLGPGFLLDPSWVSPGPWRTVSGSGGSWAALSHLALDCFVFIPPTNLPREEIWSSRMFHLILLSVNVI